jgi:hypothetical protein
VVVGLAAGPTLRAPVLTLANRANRSGNATAPPAIHRRRGLKLDLEIFAVPQYLTSPESGPLAIRAPIAIIGPLGRVFDLDAGYRELLTGTLLERLPDTLDAWACTHTFTGGDTEQNAWQSHLEHVSAVLTGGDPRPGERRHLAVALHLAAAANVPVYALDVAGCLRPVTELVGEQFAREAIALGCDLERAFLVPPACTCDPAARGTCTKRCVAGLVVDAIYGSDSQ